MPYAAGFQPCSRDGTYSSPPEPRVRLPPALPAIGSTFDAATNGSTGLGSLQSRSTSLDSEVTGKEPLSANAAQVEGATKEASPLVHPSVAATKDDKTSSEAQNQVENRLSEQHRQEVEARLESQRQARLQGLAEPNKASAAPTVPREKYFMGRHPVSTRDANSTKLGNPDASKKRAASEGVDETAQK